MKNANKNGGFTLFDLIIIVVIITILGALAFMALGTDATRSKIMAFGSGATIKCYSGGVVIYEGKSTGKIKSEEYSDGYYFKDAADKKLKEVSGNCVIAYD